MFPEYMTARNQWLLWGQDKAPRLADGSLAQLNNPDHYLTYDQAMAAAHTGRMRLGFVLTQEDDLVCVDLDNAVRQDGEVHAWAWNILNLFGDTFIEFSQSGYGLHIFFQADDHHANRKKRVDMGPDGQRLEVYTQGRFMALTGSLFHMGPAKILRQQSAFDTLCQKYLLDTRREQVTATVQQQEFDVSLDTRLQAAMVGAVAEPMAIQGQNGSTTTMTVACKLVRGYALDFESGMEAMRVYNRRRCVPPWSEKELEHKVKDAIERATSPPWGEFVGAAPFVTGEAKVPVGSPPVEPEPEPLESLDGTAMPDWPEEIMHPGGLLEDLVNFIESASPRFQPEIALAASITFLSAVCGGKYECTQGHHSLNLFFVGLGETGSGKSASVTPLQRLAVQTNCSNMFRLQEGRGGTSQGLYAYLSVNPSTTLVLDEFHQVLQAAKNPRDISARFADTLKQLFNEQERHIAEVYADATKNREIAFANFSLLGLTVPSMFFRYVGAGDVLDGFLNRMLVFVVREPFKPAAVPRNEPPSPELLAAIHSLAAHPTRISVPPITIKYTDQALTRLRDYAAQVLAKHVSEEEERRNIWARSAEKAQRLARLAAISSDTGHPLVTLDHVNWAIKLVNYCSRLLVAKLPEIGATEFMRDQQRLVAYLSKHGAVTEARLRDRFPSLVDENKRFEKLVSSLIAAGRVEQQQSLAPAKNGKKMATRLALVKS